MLDFLNIWWACCQTGRRYWQMNINMVRE